MVDISEQDEGIFRPLHGLFGLFLWQDGIIIPTILGSAIGITQSIGRSRESGISSIIIVTIVTIVTIFIVIWWIHRLCEDNGVIGFPIAPKTVGVAM